MIFDKILSNILNCGLTDESHEKFPEVLKVLNFHDPNVMVLNFFIY